MEVCVIIVIDQWLAWYFHTSYTIRIKHIRTTCSRCYV